MLATRLEPLGLRRPGLGATLGVAWRPVGRPATAAPLAGRIGAAAIAASRPGPPVAAVIAGSLTTTRTTAVAVTVVVAASVAAARPPLGLAEQRGGDATLRTRAAEDLEPFRLAPVLPAGAPRP